MMMDDLSESIRDIRIEIDSGWITLNDIIYDPDLQFRKSMWDDNHSNESMKNSIKKDGMISPPVVEVVGEFPDVKAILISGHRRVEVARESGEEQVFCLIRNRSSTPDRIGFMIRMDINQKEYTSEEKSNMWSAHWRLRHDKECGCEFSSVQKCKYSISKWSREMGIPQGTAKDHIKWPPIEPQVEVTEDHDQDESETKEETDTMGKSDRPDTYYGYKEVKARLEKENPEIHKLVILLEKEYKHRGISTCAKPSYVLSRIIDMLVSAYRTEEKNENWRLKNSIGSFIGTIKSVVEKK